MAQSKILVLLKNKRNKKYVSIYFITTQFTVQTQYCCFTVQTLSTVVITVWGITVLIKLSWMSPQEFLTLHSSFYWTTWIVRRCCILATWVVTEQVPTALIIYFLWIWFVCSFVCFHGRSRQATGLLQPAGLLYRPPWPPDAPAPTDAFRTLAADVGTYGRTGNFA
jgi:hypothetical protein